MGKRYMNKCEKDWKKELLELEQILKEEFKFRSNEIYKDKDERVNKAICDLYEILSIFKENKSDDRSYLIIERSGDVYDSVNELEKEVKEELTKMAQDVIEYKNSVLNDITYIIIIQRISENDSKFITDKIEEIENIIYDSVWNMFEEMFKWRDTMTDVCIEIGNILLKYEGEFNNKNQIEEIKKKSTRFKYLKRNKIERLLKEQGFGEVKAGKHRNYKNNLTGKKIPLSYHSKELGKGISIKIQKEIIGGQQ